MINLENANRNSNEPQIKVTSAEIVVHGTAEKPYFEIETFVCIAHELKHE